MGQIIAITPVDAIEKSILKELRSAVEKTFHISVRILPMENNLSLSSSLTEKGKYNSTALLLYLSQKKKTPENTLKLLAVTRLDLYSPIFSYMYGEAQLKGKCALMSLYRLNQEFYDLPPDPPLFLSRCRKEAIHELGHTFGLVHCRDENCIMFPSSTVEDTDTKSESFCSVCSKLLNI
jgi:archaemetzincin